MLGARKLCTVALRLRCVAGFTDMYLKFTVFCSVKKPLRKHLLKDWAVKVMLSLSLPGSGCLRASRPAWSRSGWRRGGCPSDRGPASWTSASSPSRVTLASCVRGWWRTWTPSTATTPSSSWAWSSTACKDEGVKERNGGWELYWLAYYLEMDLMIACSTCMKYIQKTTVHVQFMLCNSQVVIPRQNSPSFLINLK